MRKRNGILMGGTCLVSIILAQPLGAQSGVPVPVSPGSSGAFGSVGSACPTFSWGAADRADGYELVVYAAAEALDGGVAVPGEEPLIRSRIPGRALSWTPPAGSCLELSRAYAWSVRSVGPAGVGEWSEALLFEVDPLAAVGGLTAAVERALGRYLEGRGLRLLQGGELAALIRQELKDPDRAAVSALAGDPEPPLYRGGQLVSGVAPRALSGDDPDLTLFESSTTVGYNAQIVFDTPMATGSAAWVLAATGFSGGMYLSGPSGYDSIDFFADGSTYIKELRTLQMTNTDMRHACHSGTEGLIYWDESLSELCDCNGAKWQQVDGGGDC